MKYQSRKDRRLRVLAIKNEKKRLLLRSFLRIAQFNSNVKFSISFQKQSRYSFRQLKNRCKVTGFARSVIRQYHVNRSIFRASASFGSYFGLTRCSW